MVNQAAIHDAEHYRIPELAHVPAAEISPRRFWRGATDVDEACEAPLAPRADAVVAHVDHGQWIVRCPDCGSGQLTHPSDPRYLCNECGNISLAGMWRPVTWPKDHAAIAKRLLERQTANLMNSDPGQSADDVHQENELLRWLDAVGEDGVTAERQLWDGHTHTWGRRDAEHIRTCKDCKLAIPADLIDDTKAGKR